MDLDAAIRELWREKKRLDRVIARLEARFDAERPRKPRGRRSMTVEERAMVSLRMKEYWQKRRDPLGS